MTQPTQPLMFQWDPGDLILAPMLRGQVSNSVAYLSQPPMFIGAQTTTGQTATSGTGAAVTLDTEFQDNWNGHLTTTNAANYYGQVTGYYLCESVVSFAYTGTTGTTSAGFAGVSGGGSLTNYWGQRVNNCAPAATAISVKLFAMVDTGLLGADYISCEAYQSSGATQTLNNNVTLPSQGYPSLKCKWVASLAAQGHAPLPVPVNASWPVPPSYVTSAFLNTNIEETVQFLCYPPICEYAYNGGTTNLASQTTLPTATGTAITLGGEYVDNYSAYSGNTWTAPVAGLYYCYGQVGITTAAGGQAMAAGLTVTSSNYFSGTATTIWGGCQATAASTNYAAVVRRKLRLNAGDTIVLAGFQHDSAAANATITVSTWGTRLITVWQAA